VSSFYEVLNWVMLIISLRLWMMQYKQLKRLSKKIRVIINIGVCHVVAWTLKRLKSYL